MKTHATFLPGRAALALAVAVGLTTSVAAVAAPQKAAKPATQSAQAFKPVVEERAMAILKATSERLAAAKGLSFTATVSYEFPSKLGPAIVYMTRYDVSLQRPDRLRVTTRGDGPAVEFFYDGKSIVAHAPAENLVAVADAPPKLDAALLQAFRTAGIYFPFTDLIVPDPYAAMAAGVKSAFYIGNSEVVGGVKTDIIAWADNDVFLQMWIGTEDRLPRRFRAIFRADPMRLRHDMELSNWKVEPQFAAEAFDSTKARSARAIPFGHPVSAPPPGVKPLTDKSKGKPAASGAAK